MSDITEAVGDLAQGALIARAVEPAHGASPDAGHTHERACLNCATPLVGSHCHACGQTSHVHRTLAAFFHDLLHGVFHFEGKIWRTLPLLAWRPGRLTREYIDGRRASYVSPIALFLFSVFVMFAAAGFTGSAEFEDRSAQGLAAQIQSKQAFLVRLNNSREEAPAEGQPRLDEQIAEQHKELDRLREVKADDESPWLGKGLPHAMANPELFSYKVNNSAYKYSWTLILLSVPFVWLLFPFSRRFELYDHTVFVTYSLTFASLLAVVGMVAASLGAGSIVLFLLLVPPVHMFVQLRDAYALGTAAALWRTVALALFASVAMFAFVIVLVAVVG